jgi:hypothetical protein
MLRRSSEEHSINWSLTGAGRVLGTEGTSAKATAERNTTVPWGKMAKEQRPGVVPVQVPNWQ